MPIDTVKLKSPYLDESVVRSIEITCGVRRSAVKLSDGAVQWEITTGELDGSWDSRISLRPMRGEWVKDGPGRPELRPSEPYIIVECSLAKAFNGQNVYGGPCCFRDACARLVDLLEQLLHVQLPPAGEWIVRRVDVAESYRLPMAAIQDFFTYLHTIQFPRRRAMKYGDHAVYFPGSTTTVKLYHKGSEFAEHDHARVKQHFREHLTRPHTAFRSSSSGTQRANRKVQALQRLANNRLRVEVEIHADKLDRDFEHPPLVRELSDELLCALHDREILRLLHEGKSGMDTVREHNAVADRLRAVYGDAKGNRLYGVWLVLTTNGESYCRQRYKRASFYRHRRELEQAGVSWTRSNLPTMPSPSALPADFTPIRTDPRHCRGGVRSNRPAM